MGGVERMEQYFKTRASVDDEPDLARDRRANDARLKSRFEHIFAKYGKDFDGVGDEIDLETGRIIVNNGHIERMRHEVDPGRGRSSQVLQVLGRNIQDDDRGVVHGDGFVVEDSAEGSDDAEELGVTGASGFSSSDNADYNEDEAGAPDELSSDFFPIHDNTPERAASVRKSGGRGKSNIDQTVTLSQSTSRSISPENQPVDFSFLRESMKSMQVQSGQPGSVDADAIQLLGQNIANQLARYMTGGSKRSKRRSPDQRNSKDSRWDYPVLPGDPIDRTPTPPPPASSSAALFAVSPDRETSVWAPRRRYKRRQSKLQSPVNHNNTIDVGEDDDDIDPLQSDPPSYTTANIGDEIEGAVNIDCYNCGVVESRVWRVGPDGRLCDSCGTYYRRYGLMKAVEDESSTPALRPGLMRQGVPGRQNPAYQDIDVFAIPSTDAPDIAARYAANTARRITGDGSKGSFTLEEEEYIIRLHEVDQIPWDHIGYLVSHRTAFSVHRHYQRFLKTPSCEARRRLLDQMAPARLSLTDPIAWVQHQDVTELGSACISGTADFTEAENELISRLRTHEGKTWEQISSCLPGRTSHTLRAHYTEHLINNDSSLSGVGPISPALKARHGKQPIEDGFLPPVPDRTSHHLRVTQQLIDSDSSTSEAFDLDFRADDLAFDRAENALLDRHTHIKSRQSAAGASDGSALGSAPRRTSARFVLNESNRIQMPPPPAHTQLSSRLTSASSPTAVEPLEQVYGGPTTSVSGNQQHLPQTPLVNVRPISVPPKPLDVGPSAWAITQPASKGPLPFQPARKGLAPVHPKSARGLYDPFISRKEATGVATLPSNHRVRNNHTVVRSDRNMLSRFPESSTGSRAIDMDAQNNTMLRGTKNAPEQRDELPTSALEFTPEQDSFIKNARENRNLTWAAIAEALPGDAQHPASAITHRYYDFLLGRKSATNTQQSRDKQERRRYTDEESIQVLEYKKQGMSWGLMAENMPGRSPRSLRNHHYYATTKVGHEQNASDQTRLSKPLIRQALKNSTRRNSNLANTDTHLENNLQETQTPRALLEADPPTRKTTSGVQTSSSDHNMFDAIEDTTYLIPQSSPEQDLGEELPDHSTRASKLHELQPHAHPEVVIRSAERRRIPSDHAAKRKTPASATGDPHDIVHNHVSGNPSITKTSRKGGHNAMLPSDDTHIDDGTIIDPDQKRSNDLFERYSHALVGSDDDDQNGPFHSIKKHQLIEQASPSGTKRKRSSGRFKRVSGFEVADSDSDTLQGQDQDGRAESTARPLLIKRSRGRPRKSSLVTSGASCRESMQGSGPEQNVTTEITHQSQVAEQSRQLGDTSSGRPERKVRRTHEAASAVEAAEFASTAIPTALAIRVDRTPKIAPHTVFGTWTVPAAAVESTTLSHAFTNHSNDGPETCEVTFHNWAEVLLAAFRCHPGRELRCKDLTAWVREHNPFYRNSEEPWIHHVYNEVYRNPAYEKVRARKRDSGYVLVESKLRPTSAGRADDVADFENNDESDKRPTSADNAEDSVGTERNVESNVHPALAGHVNDGVSIEDTLESNIVSTSERRVNDDACVEENVKNVDTACGHQTNSSPSPPPAETPANATEVDHVEDDELTEHQSVAASPSLEPSRPSVNTMAVDNIENSATGGDRPLDVSPLLKPAQTSVAPTESSNTADNELTGEVPPTINASPSLEVTGPVNTTGFDNIENDNVIADDPVDAPPSLEPARTSALTTELKDISTDELVNYLPTETPPPVQPASTSVNTTEILSISSDPLVKQEPASQDKSATSFARRSVKRPQTSQHATPRAKHAHYSDAALIRRVSALATPARSGSGKPGLLAELGKSIKFEPLSATPSRASPATHVGASGRRFLVATDVRRDDGDEEDELS